MKEADIPDKFPIPWANSASGTHKRSIPTSSQIGTTDGRASLEDGWVPLNFIDESAGGVPPSGKDDNGIKNRMTATLRWYSAGMHPKYDSSFSTAIGGYPLGAVLMKSDNSGFWRSTADDNTTNPDTGGAGWVSMTVTATTDPTFANDSTTPASTSWVRRAMTNIMIQLGFSASFGNNGYIKFPSCLGSFHIQWGLTPVLSSVSDTVVTLPTPFANAFYGLVLSQGYIAGSGVTSSVSSEPYNLSQFIARGSISAQSYHFIAIGR